MVVLIRHESSSGKRRQCNSRCYNAKRPTCRCICGDMNHGKGLQQAQANTAQHTEELLKAHSEQDNLSWLKSVRALPTLSSAEMKKLAAIQLKLPI